MRLGFTLISIVVAGSAWAQPYPPPGGSYGYDRPPPYDDPYRRPPPPYDPYRRPPPPPYDDAYRRPAPPPPPPMVCEVQLPPTTCYAGPGRPGSTCHCGGNPIPGRREFDRRY